MLGLGLVLVLVLMISRYYSITMTMQLLYLPHFCNMYAMLYVVAQYGAAFESLSIQYTLLTICFII